MKRKSFKKRVLIPLVTIFTLTVLVISLTGYRLLDRTVKSKTETKLDIYTDRIMTEIRHLSLILDTTKQILKEKHIAIAKSIEYILDNMQENDMTPEELQKLSSPLDIIELNIADSNGILTHSNVQNLIGFDYNSHEITKKYLDLLNGSLKEISEEPRISVLDNNEFGDINHYIGIARRNGGFIQLGFNADVIGILQNEISIARTIQETEPGDHGYGLALYQGVIIASPLPDYFLPERNVKDENWYKAVRDGSGFAWVDIDGNRFYAGYKNSSGYTVAALVPRSDYYREIRRMFIITAIIFLLAAGAMILFVFFILEKLLKPVKDVVTGLKKIAWGDLSTRIEGQYNDEFDDIKNAVNYMAEGIQNLFEEQKIKQEKIIAIERELTQKQISIMLSQIQPHFIYNSLTAIQRLCQTDPKTAEETVIEFTQYLRGNIDSLSINTTIPFEKELEHLKNYLAIEKKRFGQRINIVYEITVRDFSLPALTLQPVAENAVRYGITKREEGGTVVISTSETENKYIITVKDDGIGFDPNEKKHDDRLHIGMENVKSRLAAMCKGTLEIESAPGKGTTAVIAIPKEEE